MTFQTKSNKSLSSLDNFAKKFLPFHFPLKYQWFLSIVLIFFAAILYLPPPEQDINIPVFQAARQEDGQHFGTDRIKRSPILYGIVHNLGGAIWSICIPLQHTKYVRRNYPSFHRFAGRLTVFVSFGLAISGTLFVPLKLAYSAPTFFLHRLRIGNNDQRYTILVWPTFEAAIWVIGLPFFFAALKTIQTARAKDFKEHQRWATILTILGYMIPLQRVFMFVISFIGFGLLPNLSPELCDFLGVPKDVKGKSDAEKAGFAWTTWASFITLGIYTVIQQSRMKEKVTK